MHFRVVNFLFFLEKNFEVLFRYMKYGMKGSNSSSTFDTLELSPVTNEEKQDSDAVMSKLEVSQSVFQMCI